MTAHIIDGRQIARGKRVEIRQRAATLLRDHAIEPCLAVIIVGTDPASALYVRNKTKGCAEAGIRSRVLQFAATASQAEILDCICNLNDAPEVHGILVQLPLPATISVLEVLNTISARKDVDGFHLTNVGGLVSGGSAFPPCTPFGVLQMLDHENIPVEGRNVTIVGASNIVGKPMALMMIQRGATVSLCHVKTRDLTQHTIQADILVAAAGQPNLIVPQMVRAGCVVIDVGINRLPDGRLVGDVDFEGVRKKASYITPVPGGVGPMTVAMLLHNTVTAAEREAQRMALL